VIQEATFMKKFTLFIIVLCLFVTGCTDHDQKDYHEYAESAVLYLYGILGDNELFEIHSINLIDDDTTGYLFYTIGFQTTYDTHTDEGIILAQATFLYIVTSQKPLLITKFNLNDSNLHETIYAQYEDAMTPENYTYDFTTLEIADMLSRVANP
jgi:hypothetical protein